MGGESGDTNKNKIDNAIFDQKSSVNTINHVHKSNFQSKSAYITAHFGLASKFIKTKTLIDTGADYNVIDSRFLTKFG